MGVELRGWSTFGGFTPPPVAWVLTLTLWPSDPLRRRLTLSGLENSQFLYFRVELGALVKCQHLLVARPDPAYHCKLPKHPKFLFTRGHTQSLY